MRITLKRKINDSYNVHIREGVFDEIPSHLNENKFGRNYVIICDKTVKELYGTLLQKRLKKNGITAYIIEIPPGEKHKSLTTLEKICQQMAVLGIERSDAIIALGGGVVGDIGGFAAAVYMRGIPFVQVPTTFLAMTDASVGGKTGVDLKEGKNLVGAFKQPKAVYVDTHLLETLPVIERQCGCAEIIKHAVIADKKLFKLLEKDIDQFVSLKDQVKINKLLTRSIRVKAKVVMKDTHEKKLRMILNYGHTIGHALEHDSEYAISHGHAVSMGMHAVNRIARERKTLKAAEVARIKDVIERVELPLYAKKISSPHKVLNILKKDKKAQHGKITFVVPKKIGAVALTNDITDDDILWSITTQD